MRRGVRHAVRPFYSVFVVAAVITSFVFVSCSGGGGGLYNHITATKGSMNQPRTRYVAALTGGKVLLAGGRNLLSAALADAELFDPAGGTFRRLTASMSTARDGAVAVTLQDGRVLIAGGRDQNFESLSSAEIYDPRDESFRPTKNSMSAGRYLVEAALLPDGRVLVVGGSDSSGASLASSDIYDPADDSFTPAASLQEARVFHFLATLPDGRIAVFGGINEPEGGEPMPAMSVEVYDPSTGSFSVKGELLSIRAAGRASVSGGKVLVSGGFGVSTVQDDAELWDPVTGTSSLVGPMSSPRFYHVSVGLPDGRVLLCGGYSDYRFESPVATADIYDPATGAISPAKGAMMQARALVREAVLEDGRVLIAGGSDPDDGDHATAEIFDPATGVFVSLGGLSKPRMYHAAVALPDGGVLITGGIGFQNTPLDTAELYDPASQSYSSAGSMAVPRFGHSAVLLANGKVLIEGGNSGERRGELFDPVSRSFSFTQGAMATDHSFAAVSILPDGRVLIAGGQGSDGSALSDAEIYDPATDTFSQTAAMSTPRVGARAVALPGGGVLIAGGSSTGNYADALATAELFDAQQGRFISTGPMREERTYFTATAFAGGKVLVAGGLRKDSSVTSSAEIYDPGKGQFEEAGSMAVARAEHAAVLLSDGRIFLSGGFTINPSVVSVSSTELFSPSKGTFAAGPALDFVRSGHSAIPLPDGPVLMLGGGYYPGVLDLASWWALGSSELLERN